METKISITARLLEREGIIVSGVSEKNLAIYLYHPHETLEVRLDNDIGALHLIDDTLPLKSKGEQAVWHHQSLFWFKNVESFVHHCKQVLNSPAHLEKYRNLVAK